MKNKISNTYKQESKASDKPHLIPGSVIMLDEFNAPEQPGETIAFREVMKDIKYSVRCSKYMKDRTFIIIK